MNHPSTLRNLVSCVSLLVATQSLADDAGLSVKTLLTYGSGGNQRSAEIICGDAVGITIDIDGLEADTAGRIKMDTRVELRSADGRALLIVPSSDAEVPLPLGGSSLRTFAVLNVPRDAPPGKYVVHVDVLDEVAQQRAVADIPITTIDRSTFGALALRLSRDRLGKQPAGGVFFVGETAYVNLSVNGYKVQDGNVQLRASVQALDEEHRPIGRALVLEPQKNGVLPGSDEPIGLYFNMTLNRSGSFVVRLEVEDVLSAKRVDYNLPIIVASPGDFAAQHASRRVNSRSQ